MSTTPGAAGPTVLVTVQTASGSSNVRLPADVPVDELLPPLLEALRLAPAGTWILKPLWSLRLRGEERLDSNLTLAEIGILPGTVVELQAEEAPAPPVPLLRRFTSRLGARRSRSVASPSPVPAQTPEPEPGGQPEPQPARAPQPEPEPEPARTVEPEPEPAPESVPLAPPPEPHPPRPRPRPAPDPEPVLARVAPARRPRATGRADRLKSAAAVATRDSPPPVAAPEAAGQAPPPHLGRELSRPVVIAVMSLQPHTGKTTIASLLAAHLSHEHSEPVLLLRGDSSDGASSGQWRRHAERLLQSQQLTAADVDGLTTRGPGLAALLYWPGGGSESAGGEEEICSHLLIKLTRFFGVVVIDCGSGFEGAWQSTALAFADQFVLVSGPPPDTGSSLGPAAQGLVAAGRPVVVVRNAVRPTRPPPPPDLGVACPVINIPLLSAMDRAAALSAPLPGGRPSPASPIEALTGLLATAW